MTTTPTTALALRPRTYTEWCERRAAFLKSEADAYDDWSADRITTERYREIRKASQEGLRELGHWVVEGSDYGCP